MLSEEPEYFALLALVRRITKNDEDFYDESKTTKISDNDVRFASLKKMQFFAKLFAVELYEEECIEILSEMISLELIELSKNTFYPKRVTTNIFDMMTSLVSLKNIFPDTESRIGRTDFYNDFTSEGKYEPGDVPDYQQEKEPNDDDFKFIVEKYISLTPKEGMTLPEGLVNRLSIVDFDNWTSELSEEESEKSFSDYFGNLEFTYKSSISSLLNAGFSSQLQSLELEQSEDVTPEYIDSCILAFNLGENLPSNKLIVHKKNLIPKGKNPTPTGITGEMGVNYGLSIGVYYKSEGIYVNLTEVEYAMSDMKFSDFDPDSGASQFDLECLVNKMSQSQEYKVLFELLFPIKMYTSLVAPYSSENFMASIQETTGF